MIAWVNVVVLVVSVVLFLYFYVKSVGPAALEKKVGKKAYTMCVRFFSKSLFTVKRICFAFCSCYRIKREAKTKQYKNRPDPAVINNRVLINDNSSDIGADRNSYV